MEHAPTDTNNKVFNSFEDLRGELSIFNKEWGIDGESNSFVKPTDEFRKTMDETIVFPGEYQPLKAFIEDVIKIEPNKPGWTQSPESEFLAAIDKHTTDSFDPRNFLSDSFHQLETSMTHPRVRKWFDTNILDQLNQINAHLTEARK